MNWDECKKKRIVKEISPRKEQVESLLRSSKKKFISYNQLNINDNTASSKVGLLYDSLRIILEALAIENGFKIYNHDCIACFLKEICNEKIFSEVFDKYRIVRNGFNYYGEDIHLSPDCVRFFGKDVLEISELKSNLIIWNLYISIEDAKAMIEELNNLRLQILDKYFEGVK